MANKQLVRPHVWVGLPLASKGRSLVSIIGTLPEPPPKISTAADQQTNSPVLPQIMSVGRVNSRSATYMI